MPQNIGGSVAKVRRMNMAHGFQGGTDVEPGGVKEGELQEEKKV